MIPRVGPPETHRPKDPYLRRVKPNQVVVVHIYSNLPDWIFTHYDRPSKRTMACLAVRQPDGIVLDPSTCEWCIHHQPERAKGYVYGWNYMLSRTEFLEITTGVWKVLREQFPTLVTDLRGLDVKLKRGNGVKAHIEATLSPRPDKDPNALPLAKAPDASILNLMRRRGEDLS